MATAATAEAGEQQLTEAEQLFKRAVKAFGSTAEGQAAIFEAVCKNRSEATQSFCCNLVATINGSISTVSAYCRQQAREKALSRFHQLRLKTLPGVWKRAEDKLAVSPTAAVAMQSVNRHIFDELLLKHFSSPTEEDEQTTSHRKAWSAMAPDEEAAIRYAGGFVAMKLKKHFIKQDCVKAGEFVECLSHMAIDGEDTSFLDYTKVWTRAVNRGGLFDVNDGTFLFFKAVELQTQNTLPRHLHSGTGTKQQLIDSILRDENVQISWSILSVDISDDDDSQELLKAIVELWVTIRGFSMTSFFMEQYKQATRENVKRKKALRKDLKKKSEPEP